MQATYIEVSAEVRYWEDATINGTEDTDGTLTPLRKDACWGPVIRLADGMVMDWPQGITADVHFKVCDAGEYWLLDDERERVAKWAGFYVPDDFLCPGDNGYGDYIILKVGADGQIEKWRTPAVEMVCECDEDAQRGWKKLPNTQIAGQRSGASESGPVAQEPTEVERMKLTAQEIAAVLDYEPEAGILRWKTDQGRANRGVVAGHVHASGYRQIKLHKKLYMAHRLAWVLVHGAPPAGELDHINGLRDDNRISNLREVSRSLNMENIRKPRSDNRLGVLGVQRNGSGFKAEITVAGVRKHLGTFRSIEEASNAYISAKRALHAGCTI